MRVRRPEIGQRMAVGSARELSGCSSAPSPDEATPPGRRRPRMPRRLGPGRYGMAWAWPG